MNISTCFSRIIAIASLGLATIAPVHAGVSEARAYVTNFGGDGVSVVDPVKRTLVTQIKTGSKPHGVAISADGEFVVVSNEGDGTLSFIDPRSNTVITTVPVGKSPHQVAISLDSKTVLVTLNADNEIAVIDVATKTVTRKVSVPAAPHIVQYSPDGATVYVTGERAMALTALAADTFEQKAKLDLMAWPRVFSISNDNRRIYQTIRWLNGALVIDADTMKVIDRIALGEDKFATDGKDAHHPALNPDGTQLWIGTQWDNSVSIINLASKSGKKSKRVRKVRTGTDPNWTGFTPDGTLAVVSGTGSNDVTIIDTKKRRSIGKVTVGTQPKRLAVGLVMLQ